MQRSFLLSLSVATASLCTFGQTPTPAQIFGTNGCADIALPIPTWIGFKAHALQADGKLLLAGWGGDGFPYQTLMARIDTACGELDPTFGQNGVLAHHFEQRTICSSIAVQADGKIVGGGLIAASNGSSGQFPGVWRYNADGSVDDTFNGAGYNKTGFSTGKVQNVFIDADGRILAAIIGSGNLSVFRYTTDGVLDSSYAEDGRAEMPVGYMPLNDDLGAVMDPDGSVTLAGLVGTGPWDPCFMALTRFLPDGDPDPDFGTNGLATHPALSASYLGSPDGPKDWSMVRRPGGGFLVGYGAHDGDTRPSVAAFNGDGSIDLTFGANGIFQVTGSNSVGSGLWMDTDGSTLLFLRHNYNSGPGAILRLTPNGQPDATFGTNGLLLAPFGAPLDNRGFAHGFRLTGGDIVAYGNNTSFGQGTVVRFSLNAEANALPVISYDYPELTVSGGGTIQWFLNGTPISGATASTYMPTENGNYTVEMNSFGCLHSSPPFQFLSTGIADAQDASITFRQDLAAGVLFIQNDAAATDWLLVDASGRALRNGLLLPGSNELTVDDLHSGMYLLRSAGRVHRFVMP